MGAKIQVEFHIILFCWSFFFNLLRRGNIRKVNYLCPVLVKLQERLMRGFNAKSQMCANNLKTDTGKEDNLGEDNLGVQRLSVQ